MIFGKFLSKSFEFVVFLGDAKKQLAAPRKYGPGAAPEVFAYEESGQVVGELAVLFRAPRAATVKAHLEQTKMGKGKGGDDVVCGKFFFLETHTQSQSVCFFFFGCFVIRGILCLFCCGVSTVFQKCPSCITSP